MTGLITAQLREADVRAHLDRLTKPPGSLGRLEDLATRLCVAQNTLAPRTRPRRIVVFAADHGVVAEGVSAWPSEVTSLMIANIAGGGAASCVLANASDTELRLVDVGSIGGGAGRTANSRDARVRAGTRNLARENALTRDEVERALEIGAEEARAAIAAGCRVLATGEMGIGNTTSAACIAGLVLGGDVRELVGRGAGADDATLERKREIVKSAVARARPHFERDSLDGFAAVGGLEIAAIAGFHREAAARGATLVLDGVIATAGALLAELLAPGTVARTIAAHRSIEPAHTRMLEHLGLEPFLDWGMRLGEGSGALLVMPLIDAAAAIVTRMATFESVGIVKAGDA